MNLKEKFDLIPDFIKNLKLGDTVYIFNTEELRELNFRSIELKEEYLTLYLYNKNSNFLGNIIITEHCINYTKENKKFYYRNNEYGSEYLFTDLKEQDAILEDLNKRMKENFKICNGNN